MSPDAAARADATTSGGPARLPEPQTIAFPAGVPGFEVCRRFVLEVASRFAPLACLRAIDRPDVAFLAIDPALVDPAYDFTLGDTERERLGAAESDPLLWLALVTVAEDGATANLRAPVVVNPRRMLGCQIVRDDAAYRIDCPVGR